MRLKAGDTLTIPKDWMVTIDATRVTISHPNYVAESLCGYSWYAFIAQANEAAEWPKSVQRFEGGD